MKSIIALVLFTMATSFVIAQKSAVIKLKTGQEFEAVILEEGDKFYKVQIAGKEGSRQLPKKSIEKIIPGCEYKRFEIDEFTGDTVATTRSYRISKPFNKYLEVAAGKVNSRKYLYITIADGEIFSTLENDEILFKTTDGTIINTKIYSGEVAEYLSTGVAGVGSWIGLCSVKLTEEDITKLKSSSIEKIRVYFRDGYHDYGVKEKDRDKFLSAIQCL